MSYVQPIGWHNELVPPSLQIFTNGCIFIFNVGENSQRFRLCNKLGLGKIRYIFLTSLNTLTFCGLPSLILSLDGCNVEHVTIFGPPNTRKVVYALLGTFLEL
ncbi:hypothetical protein BEWA_008990 [Theileria equi strain WA]|uniref:ribonuclease Z n=1 Tax=Theileria equi strain WA TaxID=1537102 RepID=L0B0V6_THEEQ|nr:hypothetical protein BEWA_008990 [Theileria equi strain WA]AFZ81487.1 hypothetical protein BEWA_008990 [Theileria equi strain WA]|eukprot:XP_004831153.1 hypothetical protein BEWA_008990 [Theileria equi strain WA]